MEVVISSSKEVASKLPLPTLPVGQKWRATRYSSSGTQFVGFYQTQLSEDGKTAIGQVIYNDAGEVIAMYDAVNAQAVLEALFKPDTTKIVFEARDKKTRPVRFVPLPQLIPMFEEEKKETPWLLYAGGAVLLYLLFQGGKSLRAKASKQD